MPVARTRHQRTGWRRRKANRRRRETQGWLARRWVGREPAVRANPQERPKLVDARPVRPRTRVRFPPPPLFPANSRFRRSEYFAKIGPDRNGCPHSLAPDPLEFFLKVGR